MSTVIWYLGEWFILLCHIDTKITLIKSKQGKNGNLELSKLTKNTHQLLLQPVEFEEWCFLGSMWKNFWWSLLWIHSQVIWLSWIIFHNVLKKIPSDQSKYVHDYHFKRHWGHMIWWWCYILRHYPHYTAIHLGVSTKKKKKLLEAFENLSREKQGVFMYFLTRNFFPIQSYCTNYIYIILNNIYINMIIKWLLKS